MKTQCIAVAAAVILMLGVAEGLICYSCNDVTAGSCRNIDSTSAYTTCTSGYTQCTTSYTVAVLNRGCAGPNVTTSCSFANVQCTYVCSTDKCNTQGINAAPRSVSAGAAVMAVLAATTILAVFRQSY